MSAQNDIDNAISKNELYAIGEFKFTDWQQAFDSYTSLAKQADPKAQFNLGYMYARGDLMERDLSKAFEWYQKAADKGDARAHYNLSQMYLQGEFVLPNNIKAKEHMDRAIELGDERAKVRTALADAKEALKLGDREKASSLFASISASNKEAEMGVIACSAGFKSIYNTYIKYSYHSSGPERNKKFWKWGDTVITEVDLTMTNHSTQSWQVLVRGLIRTSDGVVNTSTIGGVLKAGEFQSNVIDPNNYGGSQICGVCVYSDREGTLEKPFFLFHFPDTPIKPDQEEVKSLPKKVLREREEMEKHNKTAKPSGCFVLTACYGSYDAPTVLAFRQFRDQHLAQYELGRKFISWYYKHGPTWASFIENKPSVKAAFRSIFNLMAKFLPK